MTELPSDGEATEKLVSKGLGLSNGAEPPVVNLLGIKLHAVFREIESLLNDGSQFPNPPPLLTENILCSSGADDDLRPRRSNPNLDAGVAVLREFPREYLVELGEEHSISDELSVLA